MTMLSRITPAIAIMLAVLVCALPWGAPPEFRLVLPLLPYVVIHRFTERSGDSTPDWLVFLAGFATDVTGQGPLGYWALIYLCGFTMIRSISADRSNGRLSSIFLFAITVAILALMQWSVASIYYLRSVDFLPLAIAAVTALLAYLLLLVLLPPRSSEPVRVNTRLERGQ